MGHFEDFYHILGVSPEATPKQVRKAYRDKCFALHPDRMTGASEAERERAKEGFIGVNRAYDTLKDPQRREAYHREWLGHKAAPKPTVDPRSIRLTDVPPGEKRKASFIVRNAGGPYSRIWFSNPRTWLRVFDWNSLGATEELPLRVELEAEGTEWGHSYTETITVKLDEEETQVTVELQTRERERPASNLSIETDRVHFDKVPPGTRTAKKVPIKNRGKGLLTGTLRPSASWIKVYPSSIRLEAFEPTIAIVTIDTTYLPLDEKVTGFVEIDTNGGTGYIPVTATATHVEQPSSPWKSIEKWLAAHKRVPIVVCAAAAITAAAIAIGGNSTQPQSLPSANPSIAIEPSTGTPDTHFRVACSGLTPEGTVTTQVVRRSDGAVNSRMVSRANGSGELAVDLWGGLEPGDYFCTVQDDRTGQSATTLFTVLDSS